MPDKELSFENFLKDVNPIYQEYVGQTHEYLLQSGCKVKYQLAKSGYVVSYSHIKDKHVVANFVFRKSGLVIRIYGDYVNRYIEFMETLPDTMIKAIEKAPDCKLCNSRCLKGYVFSIKGTRHQKCRYNSFMFAINDESIPYIKGFLENEIRERAA